MPFVRFTGARTGAQEISTKYGNATKGDVLEVPEAVAERWTTPLPMQGANARDPDAKSEKEWRADADELEAAGIYVGEFESKAELVARLDEVRPQQKHGSDFEIVAEAEGQKAVDKAAAKAEREAAKAAAEAVPAQPGDAGTNSADAGGEGK